MANPKAFETCEWHKPGDQGCENTDASQHNKFPKCTRRCNGYCEHVGPMEPVSRLDDDYILFVMRVPAEDGEHKVNAYYGKIEDGKFHHNILPRVVRHNPKGFEFGYDGGGSLDLSLSILTAVVGPKFADEYYREYSKEFIARASHPSWKISVPLIKIFIDKFSGHVWKRRRIKKGRDKGIVLPERCVNCGMIRQANGRHHRCVGKK